MVAGGARFPVTDIPESASGRNSPRATAASVSITRVCMALTSRIHASEVLWTESGPTAAAVRHRRRSPMSPDARLLLTLAWDIWEASSRPKVLLVDLLTELDRDSLATIADLMSAIGEGPEFVDAWLEHGRVRAWDDDDDDGDDDDDDGDD